MRRGSWIALATALLMLLTACGSQSSSPQSTGGGGDAPDQGPLTVAVYGGEWGEHIRTHIIEPFVQQYGVDIIIEEGVSSVTLSKLEQQKGNPVIDVAWLDGGVSEVAFSQDLLDFIDPEALTNLEAVNPKAVYRNDAGEIFAISTGFYALGIGYNTAEVSTPPTSWLDLWKPEFAGKVTVPSPANAMGLPLLVEIATLNGGSIDNIEPGLQAMRELPVATYFDTSGNATNMFESGEVIVGAHYASAIWATADKGLPVAYVVPKEGALAGDIRVHLVNGTKHRDLALKFIDFAISAAAQEGLANNLYVAPVRDDVHLTESAAERMPYGSGGSLDNLTVPDWMVINANRDAWSELWDREVIN